MNRNRIGGIGGLGLAIISGMVLALPGMAASAENIENRFSRIDSLVSALGREVDSLRHLVSQTDSSRPQPRPVVPDVSPEPLGDSATPAGAALLSGRQKALLKTRHVMLNTTALGFSPLTQITESYAEFVSLGINLLHWVTPAWGVKGVTGFVYSPLNRRAHLHLYATRSLNRFSFWDREMLHLYALAGGGVAGSRTSYHTDQTSSRGESETRFYSNADIATSLLAAIAVDINLVDNVKLTPEFGYRSTYFVQRRQDGKDWQDRHDSTWDTPPDSDLSLGLYAGVNLFFFFR